MDWYALLLGLNTILLFAVLGLWSNWRQAVHEHQEMERAIHEADQMTGFVESIKPEGYPREPGLRGLEWIAYQDKCRRYQILNEASMFGKYHGVRYGHPR